MVVSWVSATVTCQSAFCQPAEYNPVLTGILCVLIMWSNSSLICLYFSSVRGVRMRADSSSGLSPPLFSFLLNACQVPQPQRRMEGRHTHEGTERWTVGTDDDDRDEATESMWGGREERKGEKKALGLTRSTYTQSLSADHQINVLVYFPVLVLRLGAVANRVICVGIWAVTAV